MAQRPFLIDFAALVPDPRPRRWLILPPGFAGAAVPDEESPVFAASPAPLMEAFTHAALAAPRTRLVREAGAQKEFVQRSRVFRFADYVTVEAFAAEGGATLAIYSRAVLGYSDLGVNRRRVRAWLAETARRLG